MRWTFYEEQREPWLEQCVEYSSKIEKKLGLDVDIGFE